jgi:hypothetical protein
MGKYIIIKLTKSGSNIGPFSVVDDLGNLLGENYTKEQLIDGVGFIVQDSVQVVTLSSTGENKISKNIPVTEISSLDLINNYTEISTGQIWKHLLNTTKYNNYYGKIYPYIIEYPFAYQYQDEILQNVQDYSRVYKHIKDPFNSFTDFEKVEVDNEWFNKAVLYNGQQSSGILNLVPKPINNLKEYVGYPKFNLDSKTITYTKSDNLYQYNTFWSVVKNTSEPLFIKSCENLSIDKEVNQNNMDYSSRSFKKEPLRAKYLKIRHIKDDSDDTHIVSQFIKGTTQKSYK